MKINLLIVAISLSLLSCSQKPGTIKGNVYWKYNDYIGVKPDAGSIVKLYSLESPKSGMLGMTTTDMSGNFIFEKIEPGRYFYIAHSKNTNSCEDYGIKLFDNNSQVLKDIFGFDVQNLKEQIRKIYVLEAEYNRMLANSYSNSSGLRGNRVDQDLLTELARKRKLFWDSIPEKFKMDIGYFGVLDSKIAMKVIDLKEGVTIQENIDFGLTCY